MSFDILVATHRPPTRAMVEAFVRESRWRITLDGDLGVDAGGLTADTRAGLLRRSTPVFSLGGPYPAEPEDLPRPVRRIVRGRVFLLELNLPWPAVGTKDGDRCLELCEYLARTCDGAVFDPQAGLVVFPHLPAGRQAGGPRMTPIRKLTLEWYVARSGREEASRFLDLLRTVWLEALPTRFGSYEPLRYTLAEAGGAAVFADQWERERTLFFWKARRPFLGGTLSRSPDRSAPPGTRPKVRISLDLNATDIGDDAAECDRVVDLFARVAGSLGAFFGAGYVTRGVLAGARGTQWYGPETEDFSADWIDGPWWTGLPAKATWLSWYGGPYRELVADVLRGDPDEGRDGFLVRLGPAPMDSDEVAGLAPTLPADLVVGMTPPDGPATKGTAGIPLTRHDRVPAKVVPELG